MKEEFIQENADLFKAFVDNTFFNNWKNSDRETTKMLNYGSLEFALGYACDLSCSYCYYADYGKALYNNNPIKKENVLRNIEAVMNFIVKNNLFVELELFAGEVFTIPYVWEIFDIILEYEAKLPFNKRPENLVVPSNMSFLKDGRKDHFDKFFEYGKKFYEVGINLIVSASVDGPFMDDDNRPFATKTSKYTKNFYDRLLFFSNKIGYGHHPMVHSNNIQYWVDNFLWFDNNINTSLYLLEIRNAEWSEKQSKSLYYFMKFLIHKLFIDNDKDPEKLLDFIFEERGYNILSSPFGRTGRGLGCSLQSTFKLNVNELILSPCHRLSYDYLNTGKLIFEEDGSYDFEPGNVEFYIAAHTVDSTTMVPCENCPINKLCSGGCLGANLETTGDAFIHAPTLCRMEHYKIAGIIEGINEVGALGNLFDRISDEYIHQIKAMLINLEKGREDVK